MYDFVDEEPERFRCSSIQICKGDNRGQERDKRETESSEDRYKQEQQSTKKLNENNDSGDLEEKGNENDDDESGWPSFEEEDYIVFCFEEDGAIHMVKEVKSETSNCIDRSHSRSSRTINRKVSSEQIFKHDHLQNPLSLKIKIRIISSKIWSID